jgi:hypothetical protein
MKLVYLFKNERGVFFRSSFGQSYHELIEDTEGMEAEELFRSIPIWPPNDTKGKLNFPIKDCAQFLCEGPAEVEIVATKDNFNFFSGRMLQFTMPSDERLADYIYTEKLEDAMFTRKTGSIRGDYIEVNDGESAYILVGETPVRLRRITRAKDNAKVGETFSGQDFLCRIKHGCDFATFANNFRNGFTDYEYAKQYARTRIDYVPDERLKDWVDSGIVELYVHTHRKVSILTAKVYTTNEDLMIAAQLFTPDEVKELFGIINEMNTNANLATKSFLERKK